MKGTLDPERLLWDAREKAAPEASLFLCDSILYLRNRRDYAELKRIQITFNGPRIGPCYAGENE
jgi:hypothetical protein